MPENSKSKRAKLNSCHLCKFPAGKFIHRETKELRVTLLFSCRHGLVCNRCLEKGYCERETKDERRIRLKKLKKSRQYQSRSL